MWLVRETGLPVTSDLCTKVFLLKRNIQIKKKTTQQQISLDFPYTFFSSLLFLILIFSSWDSLNFLFIPAP